MNLLATVVWFLYLITFQPYSKQVVGGPFYTFSDCQAAKGGTYVPGAMYSCESHFSGPFPQ